MVTPININRLIIGAVLMVTATLGFASCRDEVTVPSEGATPVPTSGFTSSPASGSEGGSLPSASPPAQPISPTTTPTENTPTVAASTSAVASPASVALPPAPIKRLTLQASRPVVAVGNDTTLSASGSYAPPLGFALEAAGSGQLVANRFTATAAGVARVKATDAEGVQGTVEITILPPLTSWFGITLAATSSPHAIFSYGGVPPLTYQIVRGTGAAVITLANSKSWTYEPTTSSVIGIQSPNTGVVDVQVSDAVGNAVTLSIFLRPVVFPNWNVGTGSRYVTSIDSSKDLTKDGLADVVIGYAAEDAVALYSGINGGMHWNAPYTNPGMPPQYSRTGTEVYVYDQDDTTGVRRILVNSLAGKVRVLSGADGSVLKTVDGYGGGNLSFQSRLRTLAPLTPTSSTFALLLGGYGIWPVALALTTNLNLLGRFGPIPSNWTPFYSVGSGDLDGDGFRDWIVAREDGVVVGYNGVDSTLRFSINGATGTAGPYVVHDVDGDGVLDFVIEGNIYSGRNGRKLGYCFFRGNVITVGDFNGDGISDFATASDGYIQILSGNNCASIWEADWGRASGAGNAIGRYRDLLGNNRSSLIISNGNYLGTSTIQMQ